MSPALQQIAILGVETVFVAGVVLLLFRLRPWLGLMPLAVFVGSNQYLQTILASTHYIRFGDGYLVSPGSAVLFPATLFTVLLIYHHDGVVEARSLMVGILLSNLTLTLLSYLTSLQIGVGNVANLLAVPEAIFQVNPRIFLAGTAILALDVLSIVVLYEFLITRLHGVPKAARFPLALLLVLALDSVAFTAAAFGGHPAFYDLLASQLASKALAGAFYGLVLFAYFRRFDVEASTFGDGVGSGLWAILTYRERYELLRRQKKAQEQAFAVERAESSRALDAAESRYRALFETTSDGLLVVDLEDGKIIDLNPAFTELSGYAPDELIGVSLAETKLLDSRMVADLEPARPAERETMLRRRGAEPVEIDLRYTRFGEGSGRALALTVRDITARKAAEQLERRSRDDQFISTVSHELRTPVASIYGALDLVAAGKMGELPDKAARFIDVALRNARRLKWLINDILDFQKIESGLLRLDLGAHDLGALVDQAIEDNQSYADRYGVGLVRVAGGASGRVLVDRHWLLQVLTNLLSNAVKHSPRGAAVSLAVDSSSAGLRVSVSDLGPGIPESFRDQLFQPFSQAQTGSQPEEGSTGLGLSLAKAIVEKMRGNLVCVSEEGRGTTFYFDLPRHHSADPSAGDGSPPGDATWPEF